MYRHLLNPVQSKADGLLFQNNRGLANFQHYCLSLFDDVSVSPWSRDNFN